jgi:hypothetical protein
MKLIFSLVVMLFEWVKKTKNSYLMVGFLTFVIALVVVLKFVFNVDIPDALF